MRTTWSPARRGLAVAIALAAMASACTKTNSTPTVPPNTLTILAGSELKDLEPLLPRIHQATGLNLQFEYTGSLDGTERILNGDPAPLAWFSSSRYLTLAQGQKNRILDQEPIMLSPVIMGVKRSLAQSWGWVGNPNVTWKDVATRASTGELKYAMTNPAASNSGFSALVGVASAFAGTGSALQAGDIHVDELKTFFSGQALTAGSSGFLADSYVRSQSTLGGMINYESILLSLNASRRLTDPLTLIYPKDGIITANYPLMLLDASKRAQYDKLVAYLKTPEIQRWIMTQTNRRPVNPQVQLDSRFPSQVLLELSFPSTLPVINDLLTAYLNEIRRPAHAIFVLDVSGSMKGDRLASLEQALTGLTGLDTTITGTFARFQNREEVTFITFSDFVHGVRDFTVDGTDPNGASQVAIRDYVRHLRAGGGTAIYGALESAYRVAIRSYQADPSRYTSIVLMTDGENNAGPGPQSFLSFLRSQPAVSRDIKTFAVLFGEANPAELTQVALETGGKVFDSRSASLAQVFKEIRGYQ